MSTLAYRPELDGLRSVAVYLVVAFHAGWVLFDGGFVGVDLFFVLSGFLVTGVLMRDVDLHGQARLGAFYARRVRRLLPAAVVVILATAAVQLLVATLTDRVGMVDDARASLLYYANWHFIAEGRDYFADTSTPSPFLHFWSLSIEEQFYIVFPVVVVLVVRWSRRPVRALTAIVGTVLAVSLALQLWIARDDVNLAYYGTHTRVYQLAAGAALMLVVRRLARTPVDVASPDLEPLRPRRRAASRRAPGPSAGTSAGPIGAVAAGGLALAGLVGVVLVASNALAVSQSVRGLLTTLCSVVAIFGLWWSPSGPVSRLLALPVPRYLGQISYGTYLWHWPVVLVLRQVLEVNAVVIAVLCAGVATGLAALSYQVLEMPIRRAKRLHRFNWSVVGVALATSGLVFAFVVPTVLEDDRRPALSAGRDGGQVGSLTARLDRPVPKGLDLVAAREDLGPAERLCTAEDPTACEFVDGDGPHVLLIGDSVSRTAADAFIAIAEEHGLRLSLMNTDRCPWQTDQVVLDQPEEEQEHCRRQREVFYTEVLPKMDVDVVVGIGLARSQPYWATRLGSTSTPPGGESLAQLLLRTTEKTADVVREGGADLVMVRSMISSDGTSEYGFDPVACLGSARRVADCAIAAPTVPPVVDTAYESLAVERDDAAVIDLAPLLCPTRPICSPIVDGMSVWQEQDHPSASFLETRSDEIWELLLGTGFFERER